MQAPPEVFTWTPTEARTKAFSQSGASNCGATALLNVLSALDVPVPDVRTADRAVHTNSRKCQVSASEYLSARSVAGTTAEAIVEGCTTVAGDAVESRFFPFHPPRRVDLHGWLARWLGLGCSAVATLNTQRMYGADYWHHQMIYGVSAEGVSVTNGIGVLSFEEMLTGLESPSVLEIMRSDAMRCSPFDAEQCDSLGEEWARLGVSRQLLDMKAGQNRSELVRIPAAYKAGVTVFARKGSPAAHELQEAPDLELDAGRSGAE